MIEKQLILDALADRNLLDVSRNCGVSYPTVRKIASGQWENIGYSPVERVSKYLEGQGVGNPLSEENVYKAIQDAIGAEMARYGIELRRDS